VRSEPIRSSNLGTRTQATRRRVFWAAAWRHHSGTSHWHNNNTCRDLLAAWNRDRMVAICNNHLGYTYRRRGLVQVWPEILNYLSFSIHKFTQNRLDFFFWFCLLSCSDFLRTLPRARAIALLAPAFWQTVKSFKFINYLFEIFFFANRKRKSCGILELNF